MKAKPIHYMSLLASSMAQGLIVPHDSGVVFSNQSGGELCTHPAVEGVFIPLPKSVFPSSGPLTNDMVDYDPVLVRKYLSRGEVRKVFAPLNKHEMETMCRKLGAWHSEDACMLHEAWVPVRIIDQLSRCFWANSLHSFAGRPAVLVYENSD